jgi:GNAT superfamily N-acetyltransferase
MTEKYQSAAAIWRDIQINKMRYDLIVCEHELAGYVATQTDSLQNQMWLSKFYIAQSRRGQGLGRWTFEQLVHRARSEDCRVIWLTVNRFNTGSITAYQKLGLHITQELCTDIGQGFMMDDYRMEYRLS